MINTLLSKFGNKGNDIVFRRNFRLILSIATAVLSKFIAIGSTLITMPLTLNYLGQEAFGVWMVISGVVAFMSFSDLGIGMGLQNGLSRACGEGDHYSPRYYITNAYLLITAIASIIALTVALSFDFLPVSSLFKMESNDLIEDSVNALKLGIVSFLVGMPASLIGRILSGYQKTYIANNIAMLGSVLGLVSIFVAVYFDLGLVLLVVGFVLSPVLTQLIFTVFFFLSSKSYRPVLAFPEWKYMSEVTSAGIWVVFTRLIYNAKINVPTIIISGSLGVVVVAEFSVAQKLTALAAALISVALQPLWVVYGEAYFRGDKKWVISTLKKSIILVFGLSLIAAALFYFIGHYLIALWLGDKVVPSTSLIVAFSLWMIASNINICFAMFLNGTGNFKNQSIFSFLCVGLMIILIKLNASSIGVDGVVFIMFFVSELACVPLYLMESKRVLRSTPNAS